MHNIEHHTYPENVNKQKVYKELKNYVEHECWQEGGSLEPIRWETGVILKSREEAEKWIESHDRGWYDQLAVRYEHPMTTNSNTKQFDEKIMKAYENYNSKESVVYPHTRTSEFIGCSKCNSRLSRTHLNNNFCPVCNADLRPETTLKAIKAAKLKWEKAQNEKREYLRKHAKKEILWMVKIEYHT